MILSEKSVIRAGIIPFTYIKGQKYFAFGLDPEVSMLCDFGGHVENFDSDLGEAILREFQEEALGVFGTLTRSQLEKGEIMEGNNTVEILVHINIKDLLDPHRKLLKLIDNKHEIQGIIWVSENQLCTILDDPYLDYLGTRLIYMYDPVLTTLQKFRHKFKCTEH